MKTKDWAKAPSIPAPKSERGGETKWVVPEKFFDQLGTLLDTVAPLPSEEALYGQFRVLLDAAAKNPEIKKTLVATAVETEREVIEPFFEWKRNGRPAGNGWNRSTTTRGSATTTTTAPALRSRTCSTTSRPRPSTSIPTTIRRGSAAILTQRYFAGRTDGLRPSSSEELLVATTWVIADVCVVEFNGLHVKC